MDEFLTRCENSRRYAMKIAEYGSKSLKKLFFPLFFLHISKKCSNFAAQLDANVVDRTAFVLS